MALDRESYLAKLEQLGEDKVREDLATKVIADPKKVALANEWLRRRAQARDDLSAAETLDIAREASSAAVRAADAAERAAAASESQAITARRALITAIAAIIIATIAIAVDIASIM